MQRRRGTPWWEVAVPLLILLFGLASPAPLDRPRYALAGVLLSAAVGWIALVAWRLSGLPPFHRRRSPNSS